MKFYPLDGTKTADVATWTALFADHMVLMPAVSNANLGQLTLDLLINTLLQNGQALVRATASSLAVFCAIETLQLIENVALYLNQNVEITCVGHLLSNALPPIAGSAAFVTQQLHALCLNLEVYQCKEKKLMIIQQRSPVLPGRAHAFVRELVEWAITSKVAALGLVTGCDDMLRHDSNMISRPIRTIYSAGAAQLDDSFLTRFEGLTTNNEGAREVAERLLTSEDQWALLRGSGIAPLLHAQCNELKVPFVAWVMPCAEGNNVPDAVTMATQLFYSLQLAPKQLTANPTAAASSKSPMLPFAFPPSWNQLFGRGSDVSLYL